MKWTINPLHLDNKCNTGIFWMLTCMKLCFCIYCVKWWCIHLNCCPSANELYHSTDIRLLFASSCYPKIPFLVTNRHVHWSNCSYRFLRQIQAFMALECWFWSWLCGVFLCVHAHVPHHVEFSSIYVVSRIFVVSIFKIKWLPRDLH